jgi:hypothetical protein
MNDVIQILINKYSQNDSTPHNKNTISLLSTHYWFHIINNSIPRIHFYSLIQTLRMQMVKVPIKHPVAVAVVDTLVYHQHHSQCIQSEDSKLTRRLHRGLAARNYRWLCRWLRTGLRRRLARRLRGWLLRRLSTWLRRGLTRRAARKVDVSEEQLWTGNWAVTKKMPMAGPSADSRGCVDGTELGCALG